jgi:hypothetical protein
MPYLCRTKSNKMTTIKLQFGNAFNPCTYKQVELMRSFNGFYCSFSNSQLMKRLDNAVAFEIIDTLKSGSEVTLN